VIPMSVSMFIRSMFGVSYIPHDSRELIWPQDPGPLWASISARGHNAVI